jgi:hypothetical protein
MLFVLANWNNSPRVDILLHPNTIFWFRANHSLILLISASCNNHSLYINTNTEKRLRNKLNIYFVIYNITELFAHLRVGRTCSNIHVVYLLYISFQDIFLPKQGTLIVYKLIPFFRNFLCRLTWFESSSKHALLDASLSEINNMNCYAISWYIYVWIGCKVAENLDKSLTFSPIIKKCNLVLMSNTYHFNYYLNFQKIIYI